MGQRNNSPKDVDMFQTFCILKSRDKCELTASWKDNHYIQQISTTKRKGDHSY